MTKDQKSALNLMYQALLEHLIWQDERIDAAAQAVLCAEAAFPELKKSNIIVDIGFWEEIKKAANESEWMPEQYMMNDWVSDVCSFLRKGWHR